MKTFSIFRKSSFRGILRQCAVAYTKSVQSSLKELKLQWAEIKVIRMLLRLLKLPAMNVRWAVMKLPTPAAAVLRIAARMSAKGAQFPLTTTTLPILTNQNVLTAEPAQRSARFRPLLTARGRVRAPARLRQFQWMKTRRQKLITTNASPAELVFISVRSAQ